MRLHLWHRYFGAGFGRNAGHHLRVKAAGVDAPKVAQVGVYVEPKAVKRDPLPTGDAKGCEFSAAKPNSGFALFATGLEAVVHKGIDNALLEIAKNEMQVLLVFVELADAVHHELPWAVVGDITTAFDFDDRNFASRQNITERFAASPNRKDMRVFDGDEHVATLIVLSLANELSLTR
jgi:hypothetical protein